MSAAGWYDDVYDTSRWRWWDGQQWTDHYAPKFTSPAEPQQPQIPEKHIAANTTEGASAEINETQKVSGSPSVFGRWGRRLVYFAASAGSLIVGIGLIAPTPDIEGPFRWSEDSSELTVNGLTVTLPDAELRTPADVHGGPRSSTPDRVGLGWQTLTPWDESVVSRGSLAELHVKHAMAYLVIPNEDASPVVGAGILYNEENLRAETLEGRDQPSRERISSEIFERTSDGRTCTVSYNDYELVSGGGPRTEAFIFVDDPTLPPLVFTVDGQSTQKLDDVFNSLMKQVC